MRLSKRLLDDARKTPPAARATIWDEEPRGFGARITKNGVVSFILKYRVRGEASQRFITLGEYPAVNPDVAREEARRIKTAASFGDDLMARRQEKRAEAKAAAEKAQRHAVAASALLDAWRATIRATIDARKAQDRSTRHDEEMLRYEAAVLRPAIGEQPVGTLNPDIFQALILKQPSVYVARNLRSAIIRFTKFANAEMLVRGLDRRWPTAFEVEGKVVHRSDRYTLEEAARIWVAAGRLGRRGVMLRFMLLTGCRLVEARKVEWSHLHLDDLVLGAFWEQPGHLTKNQRPHRVPLTDALVALLRWLPPRRIRKLGASPYVFCGRGGKPVAGITDIRVAMRAEAGLDDGTLHDFRRTIVSTLGDHGYDPQVADTLLNHVAAGSMPGVMGVYQRSDFWAKKREAIDTFAGLLLAEVARITDKPWEAPSEPFQDVRIVRAAGVKKAEMERLERGFPPRV